MLGFYLKKIFAYIMHAVLMFDFVHILQAEISLCRVYKRAGVEDHQSLPRSLPTARATPSTCRPPPHSAKKQLHHSLSPFEFPRTSANMEAAAKSLALSQPINSYTPIPPPPLAVVASEEEKLLLQHHPDKPLTSPIFPGGSSSPAPFSAVDDLHRLVNLHQPTPQHFHTPPQFFPLQPPLTLPVSAAFPDRLWDWSSLAAEPNKDYGAANPFK